MLRIEFVPLRAGQFWPVTAIWCHRLPVPCSTLFHGSATLNSMANRSRRQFGSVEKLPSGRYRARYRYDGDWLSAARTFTTKADANAWLAGAETDLGRGTWVDPQPGKESLQSYAEGWLKARSDLRPTTRAKYEYLLNKHVFPKLGRRELARVTAADVRAWYHALAKEHQSTADDAYRVLRGVVNTAVTDGQLVKSPCTVKGAGTVRSPERPVASIAEVTGLVEATPERYRAALLLAAWCQLRRGEVLALQRRHVDLVHGTVRVEQAWVVPPGDDQLWERRRANPVVGASPYPSTSSPRLTTICSISSGLLPSAGCLGRPLVPLSRPEISSASGTTPGTRSAAPISTFTTSGILASPGLPRRALAWLN